MCVPPCVQLDQAKLPHCHVPRESRPARLTRPVKQVRVRRAEPRDLDLAQECDGHLSTVRPTHEFVRHAAEPVLSGLDAATRKVGLVALLAGAGALRAGSYDHAGELVDTHDVPLDRVEGILLRAPDILRVLFGLREQFLCAFFGFLPGRNEVRVAQLWERIKLCVDPLVLHAARFVYCRFQDVHDKGGQSPACERAIVHKIVLRSLPLGHVLHAVLFAAAVLVVSRW